MSLCSLLKKKRLDLLMIQQDFTFCLYDVTDQIWGSFPEKAPFLHNKNRGMLAPNEQQMVPAESFPCVQCWRHRPALEGQGSCQDF